ncbi:MAG: hypothetical protein AAGA87_04450 [Pseudomonadota bacterium]
MRRFHCLSLAVLMAAGPALAVEPIGPDQLKTLITGNTLYVSLPAGVPGAPEGGIAPIYFAVDGAATAKLPAGLTLIGTWEFAAEGYCVDWDNGPKDSCSSISRGADSFMIMDAKSGEPRGQVFTIATGNAEQL